MLVWTEYRYGIRPASLISRRIQVQLIACLLFKYTTLASASRSVWRNIVEQSI